MPPPARCPRGPIRTSAGTGPRSRPRSRCTPGIGHSSMNHEPALLAKAKIGDDEQPASAAWERIEAFLATRLGPGMP